MKDGPQLYLRCEWRGGFFLYNGGKRKRWCGDAHKTAAWRANNARDNDKTNDVQPVQSYGTHECVAGFIYGELNQDGICNSCGQHVV